MGKRHGLQSADVAVEQFSLNSINCCYGVIAVDDDKIVIFCKTDFHMSIRHGFAQKQLDWSKTQIAPIVDLCQFGTHVVYVRLWLVVCPGAGLINRAWRFQVQFSSLAFASDILAGAVRRASCLRERWNRSIFPCV